jgi:hypothetical protein
MTTCSRCNISIDGAAVLYTPEGATICAACDAQRILGEHDLKAGRNIVASAWSALGLALVSLLINPFYLLTIFSISSAIYALKSLGPGNERFAQHVSSSRGLILGLSIAALVIDGLRVLLVIFALTVTTLL